MFHHQQRTNDLHRITALSVRIPVVLITVLMFSVCSCGGSTRHSSGIYSLPVPDQEASLEQGQQPSQTGPGAEYLRGSVRNSLGEPLGLESTRNLTKKTALCAFTNFLPEPDSLITNSITDIGVTLKVLDSDSANLDLMGDVRIGRMLVDGNEIAGSVFQNGDEFIVNVPGVSLGYAGTHSVMVLLIDEIGAYYSTDWQYTYDTDLPKYAGVGPAINSRGYEDVSIIGYSVLLDQPLKQIHYEIFSNPDYWTIADNDTGAQISITAIKVPYSLQNEIALLCEDAKFITNSIEVNFDPGVPGYNFKELNVNKTASWLEQVNPDCHDCIPTTEPPIEIGGPNGPALEDLVDYDPDEAELPVGCCDPAICRVDRTHPYQCCDASVFPHTSAFCRTCNILIVWRRNAYDRPDPEVGQAFDEISGTYLPTHIAPHPPAPGSYEYGAECPYEECGPNSFVDHRGGPQCGLPAPVVPVDEEDGWVLHSMTSLDQLTGVDFRPDWTADYKIEIGLFKLSLSGGWYWCPGWKYPGEGGLHIDGDHENPVVETEIISGDQMRQELDQIAALQTQDPGTYGHISCDRYYGNDFAEMNAIVAEYEAGCGKVLKVHVKDKCINGNRTRPFIDNKGVQRLPWGPYCYVCNAAVFDQPDYFGILDYGVNPLWWWTDHNLTRAYLCDYTQYPDCEDPNAVPTEQEWVYYYLIERDLEPFDQWLIGGTPYANDLGNPSEVKYKSCDTYYCWPVKDNLWSNIQQNKGCGITRISPEAEWDREAKLYTHALSNTPIDLENDFYIESFGDGTGRLHPVTILAYDPEEDSDYLKETTVAEINEKNLFFCVFYEATRDYSTHGSSLSDPFLIMDFAEETWPDEEVDPHRRAFGLDQDTCTYYDTAVWAIGCRHPAYDKLDVYSECACDIPQPARSVSKVRSDENRITAAENVEEGEVLHVIHELVDYYDGDKVLENPFVSGSEVITEPPEPGHVSYCGRGAHKPGSLGPPSDTGNQHDDPPHFAFATFSVCEKLIDVFVDIRFDEWLPVEDVADEELLGGIDDINGDGVINGQDLDLNCWDENDLPSGTSWIDYAQPESYPVMYFCDEATSYILGETEEALMRKTLHSDDPDINRNLILRLNGSENTTVLPAETTYTRTYDSQYYTFDNSFIIAWDGRAWHLDHGINDTNKHPEDLDFNSIPMYPPGKYFLRLTVTTEDENGNWHTSYGDLGSVILTYGNCLLWNSLGDPNHRPRFAGQTYWLEDADNLLDSNIPDIDNGVIHSHSEHRASYYLIYPEDYGYIKENGLGDVSLMTGICYSPVLMVRNHGYPGQWDEHVPKYTPIKPQLVLLNECCGYHNSIFNQYIGATLIGADCFVGMTTYTRTPLGEKAGNMFVDIWFRSPEPKTIMDTVAEINRSTFMTDDGSYITDRISKEPMYMKWAGNGFLKCIDLEPSNAEEFTP